VAAPAIDHQAAQATLAAALQRQIAAAWHLLDPHNLANTLPHLIAAVAALVNRYGQASAGVAADYYDAARAAAGIPGRFTVQLAPAPGHDEVDANVRWATRDLWGPQPDLPAAPSVSVRAADNLALSAGRLTVEDAVKADRKARGWARVPEPGACSFCVMLATRGAVYKSAETAGVAGGRQASRLASEPYHDHCRCHIEPVFTAYEPTAQIREWEALWAKSTAGKSGAAARRAFRQALGHN
jgi:hypothetical protein